MMDLLKVNINHMNKNLPMIYDIKLFQMDK